MVSEKEALNNKWNIEKKPSFYLIIVRNKVNTMKFA